MIVIHLMLKTLSTVKECFNSSLYFKFSTKLDSHNEHSKGYNYSATRLGLGLGKSFYLRLILSYNTILVVCLCMRVDAIMAGYAAQDKAV